MPNYRRAEIPDGCFFFTVVTHDRSPLFNSAIAVRLLGECLRECRRTRAVKTHAMVLLPDHLRAIWSLPRGDSDYSARWAWIKKEFTKRWLYAGGAERSVSVGRHKEGRRGVWQPRFWEHAIKDEDEFTRCFDYIHYNPVKHALVACPRDWPHSTFHRWVTHGVYTADWACGPDRLPAERRAALESDLGEGSSGTA